MQTITIRNYIWLNDHAYNYAKGYGLTEEDVINGLNKATNGFRAWRPGGELLPTIWITVGFERYGVVIKDVEDAEGIYTEVVTILDEFNTTRNEKGVSTTKTETVLVVQA